MSGKFSLNEIPETSGTIKDRILLALTERGFYGRTARYQHIIDSAWPIPGDEPENPKNNIHVLICRLRKELKPYGFVIKNMNGVGFKLERL